MCTFHYIMTFNPITPVLGLLKSLICFEMLFRLERVASTSFIKKYDLITDLPVVQEIEDCLNGEKKGFGNLVIKLRYGVQKQLVVIQCLEE